METTPLNICILGEYALVVSGLRRRLQQRFGSAMHVSTFCDVYQCIKRVDKNTQVLVLDEKLGGRSAEGWIRQVRAINPQVQIMLHQSEQQVIAELSAVLRQRLVPEAAAVFELA